MKTTIHEPKIVSGQISPFGMFMGLIMLGICFFHTIVNSGGSHTMIATIFNPIIEFIMNMIEAFSRSFILKPIEFIMNATIVIGTILFFGILFFPTPLTI